MYRYAYPPMPYYWIKIAHLTTVTFNLLFFALRLYWALNSPQKVHRGWVRTLSASNDTLLLAAGSWMAWIIWQEPFSHPWLSTKLLVLLAYILFGSIALTWGRTRRTRVINGILAMGCSYYILAVALSRSPYLWFG